MEKLATLQHTVLAHSRQLIILHVQRCSGGLHPARALRPSWCIAHHYCAHFGSCFAGLRMCALGAVLASKDGHVMHVFLSICDDLYVEASILLFAGCCCMPPSMRNC